LSGTTPDGGRRYDFCCTVLLLATNGKLNVRAQQVIAKTAGSLESNLKDEPTEGLRPPPTLALMQSQVPVSSPAFCRGQVAIR
jgi:hypothetical protein